MWVSLEGWRDGLEWSADGPALVEVRAHYYGAGVVLHLTAPNRRELSRLRADVLAFYVLPDDPARPARSWSQPSLWSTL